MDDRELAEALGISLERLDRWLVKKRVPGRTGSRELFPQLVEEAKVAYRAGELGPPRKARRSVVSEGNRAPVVSEGNRAPVVSEGNRAPVVSEGNRAPVVSEGNRAPAPPPLDETSGAAPAAGTLAAADTAPSPPPDAAGEGTWRFYAKEAERLRAELRARDETIAALEAQRAPTPATHRPAREAAAGIPPPPDPLGARLTSAGLHRSETQAAALRALLARPGVAPRILELLSVRRGRDLEKLIQRYVRRVCDDARCRALAADEGVDVVPTAPEECEVCAGSDNRREFAMMRRACLAADRRRLVIVGGADDTRAELGRFSRDLPELDLRFVRGDATVLENEARRHLAGADIVVIWGGTVLDHSVSTPYQKLADQFPNVLLVKMAGRQRGIASMARAVRERLAAAP